MKIKFLMPRGVLQHVKSRLSQNYRVQLAVAFLKSSGLAPLLPKLRQTNGQIVVGASAFYITDWEALASLRKVSQTCPRLGVKVNSNTGFHPKLFSEPKEPGFISDSQAGRFTGVCSNVLGSGLSNNLPI